MATKFDILQDLENYFGNSETVLEEIVKILSKKEFKKICKQIRKEHGIKKHPEGGFYP